jgi:hypothetical protein
VGKNISVTPLPEDLARRMVERSRTLPQCAGTGAAGAKRLTGLPFTELFLCRSASMKWVPQWRRGRPAQLPPRDTASSAPV